MVPFIIFLVILVVVVFAGCATFSTTLTGGDSTTISEYESGAVTEEASGEVETTIVALDVPVTDSSGEIVTAEDGSWVTTREYYEVPVSTEAPQTTAPAATAGNQTTQAGNQSQQTNVATTQGSNGSVPLPSSGATEYDILRSGTFYLKGTMNDGSSVLPLEMAVTPNTVYMTSSMDGVNVGILVDANKKVYMMLNDKKTYLEMSDAVMKYMGMSADELVSSDSVDFSKYQPLDKADAVNDTTINGVACKEYIFEDSTGSTRVYMNGTKLIRFANYDTAGKLSTSSDVTTITSNVPANKMSPPSDYKGYSGITGLLGFMGQMADLMQ